MRKSQTIFWVAILITNISLAQSEHFPLKLEESQYKKVHQGIGLDTVTLEFSRPNLKGRELFGEMLPWGEIWRVGANSSTKINFSEKMYLNGNRVPRGKYSLYVIPQENENWIVILSKNISLWGHYGYKEDEDFLRLEIEPKINDASIETFDIVFKNTSKYGSDMSIVWGQIEIPLKIEVDRELTDQRIMASIEQKINDPEAHQETIISAHVYFFAANYYHETGRDLDQAIEWIERAIATHEVNYFYYYQAEIFGTAKMYDKALKASSNGLMLFEKGTNEEWKWRYKIQMKKWKDSAK